METIRSPGTRPTRERKLERGGGALNSSQRFDPIGPAARRALATRYQFRTVIARTGYLRAEEHYLRYLWAPTRDRRFSQFRSKSKAGAMELTKAVKTLDVLGDNKQMTLTLAFLEKDELPIDYRVVRKSGRCRV